ncbi:DNA topoisomerase 2-associated protein pat1 [Basidiobolus ranarum]|uniref:DNA topoisomerase 2-associated protein pat1 n=1 Tax=Basidiobolus ranarum TaxID=34480 RepID=A0ABR2WQQ2_9FUNG
MADSFFGFNTTLPPLSPQERQNFQRGPYSPNGNGVNNLNNQFNSLHVKEEYPILEEEKYDHLGDQLREGNDDLNDETFGSIGGSNLSRDFDFAANTDKIAATLENEQRQLFGNRKPTQNAGYEQYGAQKPSRNSLASLWGEDSGPQGPRGYDKTYDYSELVHSPVSPAPPKHQDIWNSPLDVNRESPYGLNRNNSYGDGGQNELGYSSPRNRPISLNQPPNDLNYMSPRTRPAMLGSPRTEPAYMSPRNRAAPPPGVMSPAGGRYSLEEIEGQLLRSLPQSGMPNNMQGFERRGIELNEMEAPRNIPNANYLQNYEREAIFAMKQQRLREKLMRISRYNNLMTQSDKDYISRIQISQLVTDDPYADDFYYQMYNVFNKKVDADLSSPANEKNQLGGRRGLTRMQQQIKRVVDEAKRRPRSTQFSLEGALGKIALKSVKNPKQILQVSSKQNEETGGSSPIPEAKSAPNSLSDRKMTLRVIENVYNKTLELEQLMRQKQKDPRIRQDQESLEKWVQACEEIISEIWVELGSNNPISPDYPHPFIKFLNISKGKKLIPRILRHAVPEKGLSMVTTLIANFESLNVCRNGIFTPQTNISPEALEEIDLFVNTVIASLLERFIMEVPLKTINGLLSVFIERNNIAWVARSKAGLCVLTMFLTRAVMLKQGAGSHQGFVPDEVELAQWNEVYTELFAQLQYHFGMIFPPSNTIIDDLYVWEFLAALGSQATSQQQHVLVTEVREKIYENLMAATSGQLPPDAAQHKYSNVNLFLHSLGLDASQIPLR